MKKEDKEQVTAAANGGTIEATAAKKKGFFTRTKSSKGHLRVWRMCERIFAELLVFFCEKTLA